VSGSSRCWSQGKTEDEALENIRDAIREYLEAAVKISKGVKVREVEVPV
jgi:predicted RNase H-like HicB family nuclease